MLIEFDEVMSAHQYLQRMWPFQCHTDMMPYDAVRACTTGRYLVICLPCVSVLFGGYDCSSSTWALRADIHCHIFLEIKANQLDKDMIDIAP